MSNDIYKALKNSRSVFFEALRSIVNESIPVYNGTVPFINGVARVPFVVFGRDSTNASVPMLNESNKSNPLTITWNVVIGGDSFNQCEDIAIDIIQNLDMTTIRDDEKNCKMNTRFVSTSDDVRSEYEIKALMSVEFQSILM